MAQLWGNIGKKEGSWFVRGTWKGKRFYFSKYYTALGPRVCQTMEEAKQLQAVISHEMANGLFSPLRYKRTKPLHLKKYCHMWLEKNRGTIAHATYLNYKVHINQWIIPVLGNVFLPDLTYDHYLHLWTSVKRSPKYQKNILHTLYTIVGGAERAGYMSQVPEKIKFKGKFTVPTKEIEWCDADTQERILTKIDQRHQPIFRFLMITGVRPSEARALQKVNLSNREKGYITITHTWGPVFGGEALKEVKQKRERRIPFYESLMPVLDSMLANLTPFVFIDYRSGKPYTRHLNDIWNAACRKVGIRIKLNNACRHSWGNQLSQAGIDMETISQGLGHSNTAITKRYYANPSINKLRKIVDNVRRLSTLKGNSG